MTRTPATLLAALATALVLASCGTTDDPQEPAAPAASAEETTTEDMTSEDMTSEDDMDETAEDMDDASTDDMDMDEETGATGGMSGYVDYDTYAADPAAYAHDGAPVVLFFHADWCPDCRATDESLTTDGLPEGLTVVKVDYDAMTDLRRTYGVTQQHTFVQVDADGEEIATWTGATTGADILARTQGS